jgi:wobble nucleotide-excising tRNase
LQIDTLQHEIINYFKDKFSLKIKTVENEAEKEVDLNPSELFSFTVAKGVQQTLHKIAHKKDFIKQGLETITDETTQCPFCEQKIKEDDYLQIIKDYQEIFDETFSREEKNIKILLSKYKAILENLRDLQLPSQNQNFLDEVKKFITLDEVLLLLSLSEEQKAIIKAEIVLVSNKESKILEKVEGSNIDKIKTIITEATALVDSYNKIVQRINSKVKQLKDDANNGNLETKKSEAEKAIKTLKDDIFYIDNKEIFVNYFKAMDQEKKNKEVVDSLEKIYQVMKTKIVEEFNTFIKDYFSVIKDFVKEISPSMEILEVAGEGSYNRNNREPALCGFRIEYNGQDCSNSLSEGEKQVIALAFFFAHIKKETNKNKIIILDDPITSFDTGKRKSTADLIQREAKDFDQLFVFTCDPLFREYCLKQITDRNFYYIFKTKGSSSIHYVPKNKETIFASFEADFRDIENSEGSNENVVIFGQKLRFCLETKIKEDYFGYSEDKLSSMIEQVAGKGKEKFEKLIDNKDVILQIYSYCNTGGLAHYPRDGATSWNELKDKVNQYLSLAL